jgi:hypothetical protein
VTTFPFFMVSPNIIHSLSLCVTFSLACLLPFSKSIEKVRLIQRILVGSSNVQQLWLKSFPAMVAITFFRNVVIF